MGSKFNEIRQRLGIRPGERIGYHGFRHFYASQLVDAGVPVAGVAAQLGHANPSITMKLYVSPTESSTDAARTAAGSLLRRVLDQGPAEVVEIGSATQLQPKLRGTGRD